MCWVSVDAAPQKNCSSLDTGQSIGNNWSSNAFLHNIHYHCIVDYHSKFPVIKNREDLFIDNLILVWKVIFQSMGYLRA